jgi:hypothetical protein
MKGSARGNPVVDVESEHDIGRAAARALVALGVVDEFAFPAAGDASKSGHRYSSEPSDGGETSVSVSVSRS